MQFIFQLKYIAVVIFFLIQSLLFFTGCSNQNQPQDASSSPEIKAKQGIIEENLQNRPQIQFRNIAAQAGFSIPHYPAAHGQFRLFETMGGGAALFDFDNDGLLDLFLCQGVDIPPVESKTEGRKHSLLYRNLGQMKFEECSKKSGVAFDGYAQGAATGDYDGDGDEDLYVSGFQSSALYQNQGNGTFKDVALAAGLQNQGWATSCGFADFDRDGDLDLYVVRYLADTIDQNGNPTVKCSATPNQNGYCPPLAHLSEADSLYRNNGDGTFTDIGASIGLSANDGNGLGLAIADFNGDDLMDIFVANDKTPCKYYQNLGALKFQERGIETGISFNEIGEPTAAMGVATADADNDGWLDILVTNFYEEGVTFFRNTGKGQFEVATSRARLKIPTKSQLGFGTGFYDFNNDGLQDLFITNGHVNDVRPLRMPYQMQPQLFSGQGRLQFLEISQNAGDYFQQKNLGRGAAFGDLNNDGLIDIVVTHNDSAPAILLNEKSEPNHHFIGLRLIPSKINGKSVSPIGTSVVATLKNQSKLYRYLHSGGSYLSAHDHRIFIGCGNAEIEQISIKWPDGKSQIMKNLPINQIHTITQKNSD